MVVCFWILCGYFSHPTTSGSQKMQVPTSHRPVSISKVQPCPCFPRDFRHPQSSDGLAASSRPSRVSPSPLCYRILYQRDWLCMRRMSENLMPLLKPCSKSDPSIRSIPLPVDPAKNLLSLSSALPSCCFWPVKSRVVPYGT